MLRTLTELPQELRELPVADAVLEFLMRRRKSRKWKWATTLKNLATAQGALAQLPLHRHRVSPILLRLAPVWAAGMKGAARLARSELPRQPKPAEWDKVATVLRSEPDILVFAAILLAWMSAARVGCILQLATADATVHQDKTLSLRFMRGKGVLARGTAYTVHTGAVPPEFLPRLLRFFSERRTWLFPKTFQGSTVMKALRRVDPLYEQRSLRRGSLQQLSRQPGMTDELLLLFSGHATTKTLRRYLNWGTAAVHTRQLMVPAGNALVQ
jgi:hypothetical protein